MHLYMYFNILFCTPLRILHLYPLVTNELLLKLLYVMSQLYRHFYSIGVKKNITT